MLSLWFRAHLQWLLGCAFIIYSTKEFADKAITSLHNQLTLPPAKRPIQVKYAEGEAEAFIGENEPKLFVGMISKDATEESLKALFLPFGELEYVTILKDGKGSSRGKGLCFQEFVMVLKGCAFVKFKTKEEALKSIIALNGVHRMEVWCYQVLCLISKG